jgi:hypothetical protein
MLIEFAQMGAFLRFFYNFYQKNSTLDQVTKLDSFV